MSEAETSEQESKEIKSNEPISLNTTKHSNLDAYLITSVNRDTLVAPNIENIIEEEEEEEELENHSPVGYTGHKFILETVVLDHQSELSSKKESTDNNNEQQAADNTSEEVVEIKVEEGYATRQMDEYFRQTIAAIKEELTKKLENKNEKNHHNHHKHHKHHLNQYDDIEESESESELDDHEQTDQETHFDEHTIDKPFDCDCNYCETSIKSNRHLLYQHILCLTKKSAHAPKISPVGWFYLDVF